VRNLQGHPLVSSLARTRTSHGRRRRADRRRAARL